MILEMLIRTFFDLAKGIIFLAGQLPDMPTPIIEGLDFVKESYNVGIAFMNNIIGKPMTVAIVGTTFLVVSFYTAYKPLNWVFNKIRGSGT